MHLRIAGGTGLPLICLILAMALCLSGCGSSTAPGAPGSGSGGNAPPGGGSQTETNGTGATTLTSDTSLNGQTYASTKADENALRVEGNATVTLTGASVSKTAGDSSSSENSDFYGLNAGVLARAGAKLTLNKADISTSASGANAVFAYGEGTTITIANSHLRATQNNSGGIDAAGGATINATNLDIETQGASSAAIRSDRGGGTVTVDGGSYVTNGTRSPAIYSTAAITVKNATLTANNSEAIVVEGKNSVTLVDSKVTGNMQNASGSSSENLHNVMIYQSMSGDATTGRSSFAMQGGSLTGKSGDLFYVTNTSCEIALSDVDLTLANGILLNVAGNDGSRGWGKAGSNGGTCSFTAKNQTLSGLITVDSISKLELSLTQGTTFTGAINQSGKAGSVTVTLDDTSKWVLTADCNITAFNGKVANIVANGHHVYVNGVSIK